MESILPFICLVKVYARTKTWWQTGQWKCPTHLSDLLPNLQGRLQGTVKAAKNAKYSMWCITKTPTTRQFILLNTFVIGTTSVSTSIILCTYVGCWTLPIALNLQIFFWSIGKKFIAINEINSHHIIKKSKPNNMYILSCYNIVRQFGLK